MRKITQAAYAALASSFFVLAACGGGGGGGGGDAQPATGGTPNPPPAAPPTTPPPTDPQPSEPPATPPPTEPPPANPQPSEPPPTEPPPAAVFGLDQRPSNTTCLAGARPRLSNVVATRVFRNMRFDRATVMLQSPDAARWYVAEQSGVIRMFPNESSPALDELTTALDISTRVESQLGNGETGLLGMAFHPDFPSKRFIYLFYSRMGQNASTNVSRFTVAADGTVDANSELVLLNVGKPTYFHNGGTLAFGPDGYLYIGFGDGEGANGPRNLAQSPTSLNGKMARIDVDAGSPYSIPASNPNPTGPRCGLTNGVGVAACGEIFASGFRNPWKWSFDDFNGGDGALWMGEVGQDTYEEINVVTAGANYGWPCREGAHHNTNGPAQCPAPDAPHSFTEPLAEVGHAVGFSITGGYVYRGEAITALQGSYVFGDFVAGFVWALQRNAQGRWNRVNLTAENHNISSFARDADGEIYYTNYGDGYLYKLAPSSAPGESVPTNLSDTNCMSANGAPAAGLIPFAPNAPFWSDGATKSRWMALPNDEQITIDPASGDFTFPPGTVLVKNFSIDDQLIETRLFMRHTEGVWAGYSYAWNEAQTEATLVPVEGRNRRLGSGQIWRYPTRSECMRCHTTGAGSSLSPETAQLNGDFGYPSGVTSNQMATLAHIGLFANTPPVISALPDPFGSDTLQNRARSYLHSNCSGCHRPIGGAESLMDLRYHTPLAQMNACDVLPQSGDLNITNARLIAPGNASRSLVAVRMNRRADGTQMPPVASNVVDQAGVALISEWINSLQSCH